MYSKIVPVAEREDREQICCYSCVTKMSLKDTLLRSFEADSANLPLYLKCTS